MTEIERLQMNANQANSDFVAIKGKIVEKGVEVAEGTRTAEYASKVDEVYEAGRKSQYDEFWDNLQNYGNRTQYRYIFEESGFEYIRPKHKITPTDPMGANTICMLCKRLKKVEATYFDFSRLPYGTSASHGYPFSFYACSALEEIEDVGIQPTIRMEYSFASCISLHTIAKITVDENTMFVGTFNKCPALENLTIEGTIGQDGFNVQWSTKLSKASWISIINALSPTTTGKSITGSLESVKRAFETSEGANDGDTSAEWLNLIATKSNWTINLV